MPEKPYQSYGAITQMMRSAHKEILVEGPAGTGKTRGVLEKLNILCEAYPGIRVLICRARRVWLTESVLVTWENHVLWPGHPAMQSSEAKRAHRRNYIYPNGSEVVVEGLDNSERIMSTEYDVAYVNEATEVAEEDWERVLSRLRNNRMPYQQCIADCNPSYPGHWLNRRADGKKMLRFKSLHTDNPSVTNDYLETLNNLTGHRRSRLLLGLWVAADGVVYREFDPAKHIIRAFPIPDNWPIYVGMDPGYDHPCALVWFAVSPNGCLYIIDELYRGGKTIPQHCADIREKNISNSWTVRSYYADPQHAFSSTAQSAKTIAQQANECGIRFSPWPRTGNHSEAMVDDVRKLLIGEKGKGAVPVYEPKLKVFGRCENTIAEFQSWSYARTRTGDKKGGDDQFEDANNHSMDVVKGVVAMGIQNRGFGTRRIVVTTREESESRLMNWQLTLEKRARAAARLDYPEFAA